jgi:hypothetical protein
MEANVDVDVSKAEDESVWLAAPACIINVVLTVVLNLNNDLASLSMPCIQ